MRAGDHRQGLGQANAAEKQNSHEKGHDDQRLSGIFGFRLFKSRHTITDGLNPRQCGTAGGKSMQEQKKGQGLSRTGRSDSQCTGAIPP